MSGPRSQRERSRGMPAGFRLGRSWLHSRGPPLSIRASFGTSGSILVSFDGCLSPVSVSARRVHERGCSGCFRRSHGVCPCLSVSPGVGGGVSLGTRFSGSPTPVPGVLWPCLSLGLLLCGPPSLSRGLSNSLFSSLSLETFLSLCLGLSLSLSVPTSVYGHGCFSQEQFASELCIRA